MSSILPTAVPLSDALDKQRPFDGGTEPGSDAYSNAKTGYSLLKTSAFSGQTLSPSPHGGGSNFLYRPPVDESQLARGDLLLVKDSNIGQVGLVSKRLEDFWFSSGLVRLRPTVSAYWLAAIIRSKYFYEQLDAAVPRGATIRHSGSRFLECLIPPFSESAESRAIADLSLRLLELEEAIYAKREAMFSRFEELLPAPPSSSQFATGTARVSQLRSNAARFDASPWSPRVRGAYAACEITGSTTFSQLGITSRRGPNLARSVLGEVAYGDTYYPHWFRLITPTQIDEFGLLTESKYLGYRGTLPIIERGELIFGTEATFRTTVVCDDVENTTTNFHGTVLNWPGRPMSDLIYLRNQIEYWRELGVLEDLSAGGQGGHLSPEYFDSIPMPSLDAATRLELSEYYFNESPTFPGTWQLGKMRERVSAELREAADSAYAGTPVDVLAINRVLNETEASPGSSF